MRTFAILALLLPTLASAGPTPLRVCADRNDWVPYTYGTRDGLLQSMLRQVAPRHGFAIELMALPWPRCKAEVARGNVDALLGSSANEEALRDFRFPLRDGKPDRQRALVEAELVFMRTIGSSVSWDGKQLSGQQGPVLFVQSYREVAASLRLRGIPADGGALTNEQNAQKLVANRSNVMAIYTGDAQALLARPEFKGQLEILRPPIASSAYYLAFNHAYYAAHSEQVEQLWRASARQAGSR